MGLKYHFEPNWCKRWSVDPDIILTMPRYGFLSSRIIVAKHCDSGELRHGDVKQWRTTR